MSRKPNTLPGLFVFCAVIFAAALVGCGGSDSPTQPDQFVQPDAQGEDGDADIDVDADKPDNATPPDADGGSPDADVDLPETGNDVDADAEPAEADAGPEADVDIPETATDADVDADVAPLEICNGQDDNGNGLKDEGFQCIGGTSGSCQTSCGTQGNISCDMTFCSWSSCVPPAENCSNGMDDDCDGESDCKDTDCTNATNCQCNAPAFGVDCGTPGEFSCDPNVRCNCSFLWDAASQPHFSCIVTEICNGQDDNGNGQADETFQCVKNQSGQCVTACGSSGSRQCGSTCSWSACAPPAENCNNGMDDDCDGKKDCSDPDCSAFVACQPEICDGVDNDADDSIDEGYECAYAKTSPCATSCASQGQKSCSTTTCTWGACVPPAETCGNGKDDDCNGLSDCDDPACKALPACNPVTECTSGQTAACTTWCQSQGQKTCTAQSLWGACVPPAETCGNGKDDDCNGLTDCNDAVCANQAFCQSEVCNGLDDNGNAQIDETFQCKLNDTSSCTTSCNSTGSRTCVAGCMWGFCNVPVENCSNGTDDDCDGFADCWDSDCFTAIGCQHDFGTCQPHTPTNQPYTCSTWQQDVVPDGMFIVKDGCANSQNDQWVVGCNYYANGYAYHLTGGTTWVNTTLPVATDCIMAVACTGTASTYAIGVKSHHSVLLKWNGLAWQQVASDPAEFVSMWAFSPTNVWIYGRTSYDTVDGGSLFVWDGTTLTSHKLPTLYAPMTFHSNAMWAANDHDVYMAGETYDPADLSNADVRNGAIIHFDGKSWGKIQFQNPSKTGFGDIHGSSSCDVMAAGGQTMPGNTSVGITLQRNGNSWVVKTHSNLKNVASVVKLAPFKYVLQGGNIWPYEVFMGTDQGNWNVTWSQNYQHLTPGGHLENAGATWNVPGTNTMMMAGTGELTPATAMFYRSTCQ